MHVYKLPLNAVDRIPPDSAAGFTPLPSLLTFFAEELERSEAAEGSEKHDNSFPVWLFHTCMVPSQEAILSVEDKMQISFTT